VFHASRTFVWSTHWYQYRFNYSSEAAPLVVVRLEVPEQSSAGKFLADRTVYSMIGRAIGIIMSSVCLSVRLSVCDAVHPTAKVSEQVNRKCRIRNPISTPYTDPAPSNSHLLNHRRWFHLTNKLKTYCEQANRQIFHVWNNHRHHAERLFKTMQYDRLSQQ